MVWRIVRIQYQRQRSWKKARAAGINDDEPRLVGFVIEAGEADGLLGVAAAAVDFTGAEIATLVPAAMFEAFNENAREITTSDLLAAVRGTRAAGMLLVLILEGL